MAKKKNNNLIRVSINIPTELVDRVKEYAEKIGINITSAYIVLLNQALDQKQSIDTIPFLQAMFEQYMNENKVDKEQ